MIDRREDGPTPTSLDVPIARVAGSGGGPRRARLATVAVVAFAAIVITIALPRTTSDGDGPQPSRQGLVVGATNPRPSPATPAPSGQAARPTRSSAAPSPGIQPTVPDVANEPLPDAPPPHLYRRKGDDLEVLVWHPGRDELEHTGTLAGAYRSIGPEEPGVVTASPDGSAVLVQRFPESFGDAHLVRLVDERGVAWERLVSSFSLAAWSADSRWLVQATGDGAWLVVDTDAEPVEAIEYPVDGQARPGPESFPPGQEPLGGAVPVAFSMDGRWIYGMTRPPAAGSVAIDMRISRTGGEIELLDQVPFGTADAPVAFGGAVQRDPLTGRTVDAPSGTGTVRDPDGGTAFTVPNADDIVGVAWAADGALIVADGSGGRLRIYAFDRAGTPGPAVLDLDRPPNAAFVGERDGHVLIALGGQLPDPDGLLVMVRRSDGTTATLHIDGSAVQDLVAFGWPAGSGR